MSYRLNWALVCLFAIGVFGGQPAFAQEESFQALQDTLQAEYGGTIVRQTSEVKSTEELHRWFGRESSSIFYDNYEPNGLGGRMISLGVYSTGFGIAADNYSPLNYGMDFQYPTNTVNAFMTIMTGKLGSTRWWLKGMFGSGISDVTNFADAGSTNAKVSSSLGVNLEIGWDRPELYFNPLLGMSLVWVDPKDELIDSGQGNYLYAGNRLYLTRSRTLSIDLKGGLSMWRGFDADIAAPSVITTSPVIPDDYFASAGVTIHRDVNLGKVGKPLFGPLELGLMYTLPFDALETRVLAPMRFFKELSLAPVIGFGPGIGNDELSISKSAGLEIRMFGDVVRPVPSFNPYLGLRKFWVGYDDDRGTLGGVNAYLGSRFFFTDKFALDLNTGPTFWDDLPTGVNTNKAPESWVTQLGVSFALGKVDPVKKFSGTIMTVERPWGEMQSPRKVYNPLKTEDGLIEGGEVHVYAVEQAKTQVDTVVSFKPMHLGDFSDLKYFSLALDLDIGFKPFNSKANLVSGSEASANEVLLAVLFNKNHTKTQMLNERNTFFHFVDFDHGQYFGYRWDANRNRQPEYRDQDFLGEIEGADGQLYWGSHDEFVKPVKWLANDTVQLK